MSKLNSILKKVGDNLYSNVPLMVMVIALNTVYPYVEFARDGHVVFPYGIAVFVAATMKSIWMAIVFAMIAGDKRYGKWTLFIILLMISEVWFYLGIQFQTRITPFVLSLVLQTNANEAGEFFHSYFPPETVMRMVFAGCCISVMYVLLEVLWEYTHDLLLIIKRLILLVSVVLFPLSLYVFMQSKQVFIPESCLKEKVQRVLYSSNLPISDFFLSYKTVSRDKNGVQSIEQANAGISVGTCLFSSPNVVLVIGESFIKVHSSLYGYQHDTNPSLSRECVSGNLFVFRDVVSHSAATSECMKYFYSTSGIEHKDWMQAPLFPVYFKSVGYTVSLLDNQNTRSSGSAALDYTASFFINPSNIHNQCFDYRNEKLYDYDHEMIDAEYPVTQCETGPSLTIVHLMGQHVDFNLRYPPKSEFDFFCADSIKRCHILSNKQCDDIVAYDNATRYNDYVISKIIDYNRNKDAVIVYVADHGECARDDSDLSYGRPISEKKSYEMIKLLYEVPMVIWCSDEYKKYHPDVVNRVSRSVGRPYMHDHISDLLFDLAGIYSKDFIPEYSVINDDYEPVVRFVNEGRFNYDANKESLDSLRLHTLDN